MKNSFLLFSLGVISMNALAVDSLCHDLARPGRVLINSAEIKIAEKTTKTALNESNSEITCYLSHSSSTFERSAKRGSLKVDAEAINDKTCVISTAFSYVYDMGDGSNKTVTEDEKTEILSTQRTKHDLSCDFNIDREINRNRNYKSERKRCEYYGSSEYRDLLYKELLEKRVRPSEANRQAWDQSGDDIRSCRSFLRNLFRYEYRLDTESRDNCKSGFNGEQKFTKSFATKSAVIQLGIESIKEIICEQKVEDGQNSVPYELESVIGTSGFEQVIKN